MPLYEYQCRDCGKEFEHRVAKPSDPAPNCPFCGSSTPKKLLSSFAVGSSERARRQNPCGDCKAAKCPYGD